MKRKKSWSKLAAFWKTFWTFCSISVMMKFLTNLTATKMFIYHQYFLEKNTSFYFAWTKEFSNSGTPRVLCPIILYAFRFLKLQNKGPRLAPILKVLFAQNSSRSVSAHFEQSPQPQAIFYTLILFFIFWDNEFWQKNNSQSTKPQTIFLSFWSIRLLLLINNYYSFFTRWNFLSRKSNQLLSVSRWDKESKFVIVFLVHVIYS